MNVKTLASLMRVSRHTVYVWVREGKIPTLRVGHGHIRFTAGC